MRTAYLKYFIATGLFFLLICNKGYTQSIYKLSFKDIDNNVRNLQDYQGKKILFVVISEDTAVVKVHELINFADSVASKVKVIGIISKDSSLTELAKDRLRVFYSYSRVTLTEGMNIKKGSSPSELIQWLTGVTKNGHYNVEARYGSRFCISEYGRLYSVTGPGGSLNSPFMRKVINAVIPN